jgi:predicted patatin/cPLA2 family phospholipase
MNQTALILEGGGMRGIFTAGVVDALIEKKIYPGKIYGVSAGACHAISLLSKQKDRARRVVVDYCTRNDYFGLHCMIHEKNMFGWNLIFNLIPNRYDPVDYQTFFSQCNNNHLSSARFYITATNARSGKATYLIPDTKETLLTYAKASCSLPFLCRPVYIDSEPYFDGGIADSIPIRKAISDGATTFIIVLTQSSGYTKEQIKYEPILQAAYHQYPALVTAMMNRATIYNESLAIVSTLESEKKAIVIRPPSNINVSRLERSPEKLTILYQSGYDLGQHLL